MPPVMMYEAQHTIEIEPLEEPARAFLGTVLNAALDWILTLDEDDQREFWSEVRQTLRNEGTRADLETIVHSWCVTAEVLSDPLSREVLLAERHEPDDYQQVGRPA